MSCRVVVGAQWGDEGKGKIVDYLSQEADIIARYQGGANAGHTVVIGEEEFVLHQIPTGILHPGKVCILGNGVVVDPQALTEEMALLARRGITTDGRLKISEKAHLLLSYHRLLDQLKEEQRGEQRLGTTGRGIGPAYEDKVGRRGIRIVDLGNPSRLRSLVDANVQEKNGLLERAGRPERLRTEALLQEIEEYRGLLQSMAVDASLLLQQAVREGRRILLEGAQGSLLDLDHGTYPYVTASSTTAGGAAIGVGLGPRAIDEVIGVVKAYTTRVGEGPLPTELNEAMGARLRELGREFGATTGRPRRCGWFDAVVVRYAARINGLTSLAVTKLDVLDAFSAIKICTSYRRGQEVYREFHSDYCLLTECQPVYEELPGWEEPTGELREFEELPERAKAYLCRVEELVEVPIQMISVGQKREQVILKG